MVTTMVRDFGQVQFSVLAIIIDLSHVGHDIRSKLYTKCEALMCANF